jgi:glucose/arabinose dehydrogenase
MRRVNTIRPSPLVCACLAAASLTLAPACSAQATNAAESLTVPAGFTILTIAHVPRARELAALPNGDLVVGSESSDVYIVPNAEASTAGQPHVLTTIPDDRAAGVAFSAERGELYIAGEHGVYAMAYRPRGAPGGLRLIARVRTGPVAPDSDGDIHKTTSVVEAGGVLYVSVGSSCNACTEADPTRASILRVPVSGGNPVKRATRIRNAIALTINPSTGSLWAGNAGQDNLPLGHPYEFLDDVTSHVGVADYGWPQCEENRRPYAPGADCTAVIEPLVVLPAYSTIIGATFYPENQTGRYAFPKRYRGWLFATAHGSWHTAPSGGYAAEPQVVAVPMNGDRPLTPVNWQNPHTQWQTFVGGFQPGATERIGRPTGIAVGSQGSLFVADDLAGAIYRIRPKGRTP